MSTANSTLRLSVEHNQYDQGLRDAKKSFEDFTKSIGVNIKSMTAAGAAIGLAAAAVSGFSEACKEAFQRGSELAKQAEGVRMAYQRLGDGSLLDGLREATHGTVSDLELMKAAVKFQDFKLPVEELGTMLAFAQQKAKDTGQSVDYMVDSIVTGLGRKSLMILDNLGLSAAEVKDKMKETGDMTKAVGSIIREQMSKAGDYVETAADRATKANVELENAMLELGQAMQETFGYTGWDDMAKGIKTELVGALTFTIETINEAKNAWNGLMQMMGVQPKPQKPTPAGTPSNGMYFETTDADGNLINAGRWMNGQKAVNTFGVTVTGTNKSGTKTTKPKGGGGKTNVIDYAADSIAAQEALVQKLTNQWKKASAELRDGYLKQLEIAKNDLDYMTGKKKPVKIDTVEGAINIPSTLPDSVKNAKVGFVSPLQQMENDLADLIARQEEFGGISSEVYQMFSKQIEEQQKKIKKFKGTDDDGKKANAGGLSLLSNGMGQINQGITQMVSSIEQFGIEIPEGLKEVVSGISTIVTIVSGISTTLLAIEALTATDTLIPFARGGIVPHAAMGWMVPGHDSTDRTPVMVSSGELILNRAQQSALASQLQGVGLQGMNLEAIITGEQIRMVLNNNGRRTGRGEYVQSNFR